MQIQAIQGYFIDQDRFIPLGDCTLPLRKRAIVTILDEPIDEIAQDDVSHLLKAFDELNAMIDASGHEEMPYFKRACL